MKVPRALFILLALFALGAWAAPFPSFDAIARALFPRVPVSEADAPIEKEGYLCTDNFNFGSILASEICVNFSVDAYNVRRRKN